MTKGNIYIAGGAALSLTSFLVTRAATKNKGRRLLVAGLTAPFSWALSLYGHYTNIISKVEFVNSKPDFDLKMLKLTTTIPSKLINRNKFGVKLDGIDGHIYYKDAVLGRVNINAFELQGNSEKEFDIVIESRTTQLLDGIVTILTSGVSLNELYFDARFRAYGFSFRRRIPLIGG